MINIFALSKTEVKKRQEFRCKHRHNGISHPKCYDAANGIEERIAVFDIETSSLKASYGFIFSFVVKTLNKNEIYRRVLTPEEIHNGVYDKNLVKELADVLRKYNRVCGYYSSRFDAPFARTRAVLYDIDFPIYNEVNHTDVYDMMKKKFKLHSNKLGVACSFFGIKAKEHPLSPSIWFRAMAGKPDALKFVLTHNIEDVYSTEKLMNKIWKYSRITKSSI